MRPTRADDAHRDVRAIGAERAAHGDGPLAGADFIGGRIARHRQIGHAADLQQHEHPAVVGGDQLGRRLFAGGERDEDRRRLLGEVERAGKDVAVGRNHEAGRGAVGEQRAVDDVEAADGANLHDRRGDGFGGGLEGGFFAGCERVVRPERSTEAAIANCKMQNANCKMRTRAIAVRSLH